MRIEVRLPQWGMGMTDGEIVEWYKQIGEPIAEGDALAEVETAKVTETLESPATGVLIEVLVAAGDVAEVRDVLAIIEAAD